jgi:hypothetical protein
MHRPPLTANHDATSREAWLAYFVNCFVNGTPSVRTSDIRD